VAGPEELLCEEEDGESDETDDSGMRTLVDAALGPVTGGEQQQLRRSARTRGQRSELSMEDFVLDADLEQDQQRVALVRGESAAAAGQAGGTAAEKTPAARPSCLKRKSVCV
jgi:hypothetical protein